MTTTPSTEAGRRLFTDNEPGDMLESDGVTWDDVCAIEAEARAAGRAEAVEGLRALSEAATPGPWISGMGGRGLALARTLACPGRTGEEKPNRGCAVRYNVVPC